MSLLNNQSHSETLNSDSNKLVLDKFGVYHSLVDYFDSETKNLNRHQRRKSSKLKRKQ